jgi:transketolase
MIEPVADRDVALEQRCIDTIRFLAVDAVQRAKSGHPGAPMGAAPMAHVLFTRHLRFNPHDPGWPDRDRFILSAGHASMLLYSLLHLTGYGLTIDDLRDFRQLDSKTPGHPEYGFASGVETTTGPLGQGLATSVGFAMAEAHLTAQYNDAAHVVVDHRTYVIASDGDLMEGVSSEASSLAGHLGLGKLIVLYDDNHISIDGSTDLAFTEDRCARYRAYGWHVQYVDDGNDLEAIDAALTAAEDETGQPSFIAVRTHIGYGSPNKQDTASAHGEALGADEVKLTKENMGWPLEPEFYVPDGVYEFYGRVAEKGAELEDEWRARFDAWKASDPARARQWEQAWARELPEGWDDDLPVFEAQPDGPATRAASGKAIEALLPRVPALVGGSGDLTPSNNTRAKGETDFQRDTPEGRYIRFGVREHAMTAAANGLCLHGGLRPYVGTFFIFSDYLKPAMRIAALTEQPVILVFTHDSIGLGEDGPTHQPVEHLPALRAIPHLIDIRPADANEAVEAWKVALRSEKAPVAMLLSRQKLPVLDRERYAPAAGLARGGYVLADCEGEPEIILLASGSEVQLAIETHERLMGEGVRSRVVNLASWRLFENEGQAYRDEVLPPSCRARLAVEAAATLGWERWVGLDGDVVGLDRFGASAPYAEVFNALGFTADNVYARAKTLLAKGVDH